MSDSLVIVLCADCKAIPIVAQPRYGYDKASYWDGLLVCGECAKARGPLIPKAVA